MEVMGLVMGLLLLGGGLATIAVETWDMVTSGETDYLLAMWIVAGFVTAIGAFIMWPQLRVATRLLRALGRLISALPNRIRRPFRVSDARDSKAVGANKPVPRADRKATRLVVEQNGNRVHGFKPVPVSIDMCAEMTTRPGMHQTAVEPNKESAIITWVGVIMAFLIVAIFYMLAETQRSSLQSHRARLHENTAPAGGPGQWGSAPYRQAGTERELAEGDERFSDWRSISRPGFGGTPPAYQDAVALEDLPEAWQRALVDVPANLRAGIQMGLRGDADGMLQFLSSVAAAGEQNAYLPLAVCYLVGIGTDPDPVMAVPFLKHQSQEGCHRSIEILEMIDEAALEAAKQISAGETERRAIEIRRPRIINYGATDQSP